MVNFKCKYIRSSCSIIIYIDILKCLKYWGMYWRSIVEPRFSIFFKVDFFGKSYVKKSNVERKNQKLNI